MKKGVVGVLILLALLVLVSPAIVGRMAEKSMDENLNWAAQESGGELSVTSEAFSRGWFSSEGQHRVSLKDGDLKAALQAMTGPIDPDEEMPTLVINTKLDHGLFPVASMSRERGSLQPGLGSAVSTLSVEFPGGESFDVPGKIFSKVGLGGELLSNYVLEPGSHSDGGATTFWGATDIEVKTDPKSGDAMFRGTVGSLSVGDGNETVSLGALEFDGSHQPTEYGVSTGSVDIELEDLAVSVGGTEAGGLQAMSLKANTELDGTDVNADAVMSFAIQNVPQLGEMSFDMAFELLGADAELLGRLQRSLDSAASAQDPFSIYAAVEDDLLALFASGFEMNFDRADMTLPQGTLSTKMLFTFHEKDPADFAWTSLLLSTEAAIDISIPEALMDMVVALQPNAAMAIGGGYLVKRGDAYKMDAQMKKGLLTINGAPFPIPFGATR